MLTVSPVRRKRSWNTDQVLNLLVGYDWQSRWVGETISLLLAQRPDLIVGHNHLPVLGEVDVKLKHLGSPDWLDRIHTCHPNTYNVLCPWVIMMGNKKPVNSILESPQSVFITFCCSSAVSCIFSLDLVMRECWVTQGWKWCRYVELHQDECGLLTNRWM